MAALNGDAAAEPSGLRAFVGRDSEIHLADGLSSHLLKGVKHAAGPYGRLQLFIGHLEVAAVAELEEGLDRPQVEATPQAMSALPVIMAPMPSFTDFATR